MRIIYAGSPDVARQTLEILFENQNEYNFEIVGVISNPPSAKGRHKELTPTPVAAFALENQIPCFTPSHLDSTARSEIQPLNADLLICFAYGHIFGPKFLEMFPLGGINLHPSALPKYRGCTPVNAAILNRDEQTAVTIQKLSLKMDEGNVLAQKTVNLDGTETATSLLEYSAKEGAQLILQIIKNVNESESKTLPEGQMQSGEASYTNVITKNDAKIDWNENVINIEAKIRAYYEEPGCWCFENELPLKILKANVWKGDNYSNCENVTCDSAPGTVLSFEKQSGILIKTGDGILCVKELQRQGKKNMNYKDFMNGARDFVGSVLK